MTRSTAIVLAGGRSSRMGEPKALLPFDGKPLIVHVVETLRTLCSEIVVVAAPGQDLPTMPVTLVRDSVAYQGPVGGIYYGLTAATEEVGFVTSCDSVFLNPGVIRHCVSVVADHDVAVPHWQGRFQPLHAAYRRSVLPHLEGQLERGELRPVYLFDRVRTRRIDESEIRDIDPEGWSFFNMNTREEYQEALRRWPEVRARLGTAPGVSCTVELFGVARMVSRTRELSLSLPAEARLSHVLQALAERLPMLVGRVIAPDRTHLVDGYTCSVNGVVFVRDSNARINPGDSIILLAADAGG